MRVRVLSGVAVAASLTLAVACGGSDSGQLSLAEFRDEANAVCRNAEMTLADVDVPTSPEEFVSALAAVLPLQEELIEELRDIEPPEELVERYGDALELLSEQLSLGQQALDDIEGGGDPAAVITTLGPEIQENEDRLDEVAVELGLTACAESGGAAQPEPAPPRQQP